MKRRTLLGIAGAATIPAIAGCLGDDDREDDGPADNETEPSGNETDNSDGETGEQDDERTDDDGQTLFAESFSATSRGGFLAIDEETDHRTKAREAGFALPEGEDVLTLEADVSDDGSWESTKTEFPPIETEVSGLTVEARLELPAGLNGVVFQNRMTATGTVEVVIESFDGDGFSFEVEATTAQSGDLEGETNFEEESLTVTVVDNEFTIDDDSGNILIDDQLGLPADEAGTNWFEIELELTGT